MPDPSDSDTGSTTPDAPTPGDSTPGPGPVENAPGAPAATDAPPPGILGQRPVAPKAERHKPRQAEGSIKETIISMMISLAMALVAKAYVIEAFVIPTGSMAPTLLGKHMKFSSPQTGYEWTVNPWFYGVNQEPLSIQREPNGSLVPNETDPMTVSRIDYDRKNFDLTTFAYEAQGLPVAAPPDGAPLYSGDRILVHKYLYEIFPPERYDVVVFKNPEDATVNFIKRLVGLPNEQIWLADGDVFARSYRQGPDGKAEPGAWAIQRKPAFAQRDLWRTIYSSEFVPLEPESRSFGKRWFHCPWQGEGWETEDARVYRAEGPAPGTLTWDVRRYPITDWEPYNDARYSPRSPGTPTGQTTQFPVGDLRMRAVVTPDEEGLRLVASIKARGQTYQAAIEDGKAIVRMRDGDGPWSELAPPVTYKGFKAGKSARFEFWHVDQSLQIWIDGRKIIEGVYDWTPGIRLYHSTGKDGTSFGPAHSLADPALYAPAETRAVEWTFENSPVSLSHVGLDRDIYYQPRSYQVSYGGPPALATHPMNLATLGPDQFFMLGDNSPSSKDGRLWDRVDTEVAEQIDPSQGVVNRKLLLGKAFFVYFPAPNTIELAGIKLWVPDFGNMRFIR